MSKKMRVIWDKKCVPRALAALVFVCRNKTILKKPKI